MSSRINNRTRYLRIRLHAVVNMVVITTTRYRSSDTATDKSSFYHGSSDATTNEKSSFFGKVSNIPQGRFSGCEFFVGAILLMGGISASYFFLVPSERTVAQLGTGDREHAAMCKSSSITRASVAAPGIPIVPDGFTLRQATVHQRHLDRWIYEHNYINNVCWENQKNSTDLIIGKQCSYNLSSIWEHFEFESDPYSAPERGSCNPKQLTIQGKQNAEILGKAYRDMFPARSSLCDANTIRLESDAAQKNQQTTMHVFKGICEGKLPDIAEHTPERVLDDGTIASGRPFFLRVGICTDSDFLHKAQKLAAAAFLSSDRVPPMKKTAKILAEVTGKPFPEVNHLAELEDNILDCIVCHFCHGLDDTPIFIWPILDDMDQQETASRVYIFDFFEGKDDYQRVLATYFGYYFVTLFDRMQRVVEGEAAMEPMLYVQVTSDDRLSAILKTLDAPRKMFSRRPPWGSQIVFQLLEKQTNSFYVRTLYNGEEMKMQSWGEFTAFVKDLTPSKDDCSTFFDNYP